MMKRFSLVAALLTAALWMAAVSGGAAAPHRASGWLSWRGPLQTGVSLEKQLPESWTLDGANQRWSFKLAGRGTPVIANGRLYAIGYQGQGPDLQEVLICLNAETGKKIWERRFSDFLSDVIYDRYSIGSPAVDPATGNVYALTSPGLLLAFTADGKPLWQHSMMEEFGRLTFPNGRTGAPLIDGDLVIARGITSNWGRQGPARDRFYAFDKQTGELVWASTPGIRPRDSDFSLPILGWSHGKRVFYTGTGDGNIVCVNARTGQPLWRFYLSIGGINSSVVEYKNSIIAIHGRENLHSTEIGRMVAVKTGAEPKPGQPGPVVLDPSAEIWRNRLSMFTSSPVLVGNRIYQMTHTGELACVDADNGHVLWQEKLGPDELHASPVYGDGKLYVPLTNGSFFILKPSDAGVKQLAKVQLPGSCLGAPAIWNGKVYVFTTERLFCFGRAAKNSDFAPPPRTDVVPKPGKTASLQIIPAEVLLRPGQKARFRIRGIDKNGFVTRTYKPTAVKWRHYIPATAKVKASMKAEFNAKGELVADAAVLPSAGAYEATVGDLKGYIRGRVLPTLPFKEDFERFKLTVPHKTETGVLFAYPPLAWIGARFKWEIRNVGGSKALAKTLDNELFQRAVTYFGHPDERNYTLEADVMSDGNRRIQSTVGVINQRYLITLLGNEQRLEVSSNQERVKASVPFAWRYKVWYRLKTRVDIGPDGAGVIRAKAWKRGDPEPAKWTIEVPHRNAHTHGAAGLFGFAPQSKFRVYIDNVSATAN